MDDVKQKLCFVYLDVDRDLQIARRRGKANLFRCTYVLPDGITHMRGYVKDKDEARRYMRLDDGASMQSENKDQLDQADFMDKPEDRRTTDLSKNEFCVTNERFIVPKMIFCPADLGMNKAGLAEFVVRAVNSCHPHLHPMLYESIIFTGGSTLFPQFAERLETELRPLAPEEYQVKITCQEETIKWLWIAKPSGREVRQWDDRIVSTSCVLLGFNLEGDGVFSLSGAAKCCYHIYILITPYSEGKPAGNIWQNFEF